jgi:putative tryptophan/tyrosine transport system substrate-binding protein
MRRREFIAGLGGAAALWPLVVSAQQATVPVLGFLNAGEPTERAPLATAVHQGLKEAGFVEGQNLVIEYRWAEGRYERLPALAEDLVRHGVAVIVATGGPGPAVAAKAVTSTIPIVFTGGGDPVRHALVASLSRPGGNATGIVNISSELESKRLQLLHEMVPAASAIGVLSNPNFLDTETQLREVERAARTLGLQVHIQKASTESDFDVAFAKFVEQRIDALFIGNDPMFLTRREQLVALAARHAFPASYFFREFVAVGGLMSYGPNILEVYHKAGIYAGLILRGAKPADLPVQQPTKFDLSINLKTTKSLGLSVPDKLLAIADEVIE